MTQEQQRAKDFIDAASSAGYNVRSYSGRGMYGDSCLGIVADNVIATVVNVLLNINIDEQYDFLDVFESARTDSMGMSDIVYFPKLKVTPEIEKMLVDSEY